MGCKCTSQKINLFFIYKKHILLIILGFEWTIVIHFELFSAFRANFDLMIKTYEYMHKLIKFFLVGSLFSNVIFCQLPSLLLITWQKSYLFNLPYRNSQKTRLFTNLVFVFMVIWLTVLRNYLFWYVWMDLMIQLLLHSHNWML